MVDKTKIIGLVSVISLVLVLAIGFFVYQSQGRRFLGETPALYQDCVAGSYNPQDFRFVLEQRFPDFATKAYTIGDQPQFDENGQSIGVDSVFLSPVDILIQRNENLGFADPRVLATLIEVETQGLSRPELHVNYPLNNPKQDGSNNPFFVQINMSMGILEELKKEHEVSVVDSAVLYEYFSNKYSGEELGAKVAGESSFSVVFRNIFGVDPLNCQ